MKKLIYAISALALLTGISASCQKEFSSGQDNGQSTKLTVTATIADSNSGTKVSYEHTASNSLQPYWEVNDIIIGFDGAGDTYGYKVTSLSEGKAILEIITTGEYAGSVKTDPSNGTNMYMFYAPGKKPSDILSKSLTVSLANQSKDVVPALMMASAMVNNNSLSLSFVNKTAVLAIKSPTMVTASTAYTSFVLSGTGINTEVLFSLDGSNNLQATYQTEGTITKAVNFVSHATTKLGAELTYIVACPLASATDLTFTANTGESFKKTAKTMEAGKYYYMTPTFTIPDTTSDSNPEDLNW